MAIPPIVCFSLSNADDEIVPMLQKKRVKIREIKRVRGTFISGLLP